MRWSAVLACTEQWTEVDRGSMVRVPGRQGGSRFDEQGVSMVYRAALPALLEQR